MSLSFVQQLETVARHARRRRWMAAACWAVAAFAVAVLSLIAADWLLGVYHVAGRILLTTLLVLALGMIVRRAVRATTGRTTSLDVALELERRHPEHRSLLASGLEFSGQEGDDPTDGSIELRRAVVMRASLAAEAIDLEEAAPRAPLRRAAIAAVAALAVLAAPAAIAPQGLATGLVRLFNPLSAAEWPRAHELEFVDLPSLIPAGSDFRATLRDRRGALPESVEVDFRTRRQARWHAESQTYAAGGETLEVRWPNVQDAFEVRARGSDHQSMPWRRIATAAPPQIESLEMTAHPPAYTGRPAEVLAEPFRVLAGSTLSLRATTSLPVASGELQAEGQGSMPLQVRNDGLAIQVAGDSWRPAATGEWSFRLITPAGMAAQPDRRLHVEVTPDQPPSVEIASPTEELVVVPEAAVDLNIVADDDLAVQAVRLTATPLAMAGEPAKPFQAELYRGPEPPQAGRQELVYPLDVSALPGAAGSVWEIRAQAEDYAGHGTETPRPVRLRVVTHDAFLQRLDGLLARLSAALTRGRQEEDELRQWIDSVEKTVGVLPREDQAQEWLSRQRRAAEGLINGADSALGISHVVSLENSRNRWDDEEATARLEHVGKVLLRLKEDELPAIDSELAQIARDARVGNVRAPNAAESKRQLAEATELTGRIVAALDELIHGLEESNELRQFQRELVELKSDQQTLRQETEAAARASLTNPAEVKPQEVEEQRQQLASRQRELGTRLAGMLTRMRAAAESLAASKPQQAARLDAVASEAQRTQLPSMVRTAAEQLAASRFAQAAERQRNVESQFEQLMQRFGSTGQGSTPQRLGELQKAEQQLETVRRENAALVANNSPPESQQMARQSLSEKAEQLAQRLQQLRAAAAAQSTKQAAESLASQKEPGASQQKAGRKLEQAQRELAAERRHEQTQQTKRQIDRLDAALQRLVGNQQAVVAEAGRLSESHDAGKAEEIAKRQAAVREEAGKQADQIVAFPVFARMLRTAADTMQRAESQLASAGTPEEAAVSTQQALDQLTRLAEAVHLQRQQQAAPPRSGDQAGTKKPRDGDQQKNNADQIQALQLAVAQLSLLRTMQDDLKGATAELEQMIADRKIDEAAAGEQSNRLATEQLRELAKLAETLENEVQGQAPRAILPGIEEKLRRILGDRPDGDP